MAVANLKLIKSRGMNLDVLVELEQIIKQGGPTIEETATIREVASYLDTADESIKLKFYDQLKSILTIETLLGFTFLKPHGYAGDFELIDRIHTGYVTDIPELQNWDHLYHSLSACVALRNRKAYFNSLLDEIILDKGFVTVLNLGSGPARDIKEYLDARPHAQVRIDCVDMDKTSIVYAQETCKEHLDKIRFFNKNVLRLRVEEKYDLVWSAGMFDYFNDKLFMRLVSKYFEFVKKGGQLVIGNINSINPDKVVMEVFAQWFLNHRSEETLTNLVNESGIKYEKSEVLSEPTGVNIFTHTYK